MADLSVDQLAYLHSVLGTVSDEDDMQERFDRLGDVRLVAAETLDQRVADATLVPQSFSVPGEYSQDMGASLTMLTDLRNRVGSSTVVVTQACPSDSTYGR